MHYERGNEMKIKFAKLISSNSRKGTFPVGASQNLFVGVVVRGTKGGTGRLCPPPPPKLV